MFIVYKKGTLKPVNSINTLEDMSKIETYLLQCHGGTLEDYASIETDLQRFHLETQNGVVVAVEDGLTIEEQRQAILTELARLDVIVPRVLEDIISQGDFTIHQSKLDIIAQKETLRQQLQELEV